MRSTLRKLPIHNKRLMLGSVTILALGVADIANAQAADPAASNQLRLVDEVVVTARRREERLQDVPASIASVSAATLASAGVDNVYGLSQVAPGVNFTGSGTSVLPIIRGVSSTNISVGDESNVAIYIDGVYMSQTFANAFKFNNIERIEVLKGPQGTLFGRNATGGAISIFTKDPSPTPTAKFSIGRGNLESTDVAAYFSAPIGDNIAFDIAAVYHNDEGYVKDLGGPGVVRGGNLGYSTFLGFRGKVVYTPTDWAKFTLAADSTSSEDVTTNSSQALNGNTVARVRFPTIPVATGPYQYTGTARPMNDTSQDGISLKVDLDLGWANFVSITARRRDLMHAINDTDGSFASIRLSDSKQPSRSVTQEFQLSSAADSRIQWVAGAYYLHNYTGYKPLTFTPAAAVIDSNLKTDAWAGFGELTVETLENFTVTAGLRYSYEEKNAFGTIGSAPKRNFKESWDDWTPRIIAKYEIPGIANIYGSYSKGFKSGQLNSSTLDGIPVRPEYLDAVEVGVKSLWSGPWRGTATVYNYDYKDIQTAARPANSAVTILTNAAKASIRGAEFTVNGRVTNELTVDFGLTYTDSKYDSFPNANVTIPTTQVNPTPATACVSGTGAAVGGNRALICDVTGNRVIRTPKWTTNASARYERPLAVGTLDAYASILLSDSFFFDPLNRLKQSAYTVVNGEIGWTAPDNRTRVSVWGNNLTDEVYFRVVSTSGNADWVNYASPRTYGVRLAYTY
ncbi:TonB-dependent receptor [Phenylobacterium sp. VNQ135]|uniref:TonB-dependent receptor n=1 Tax=Phenylobacterium sp. VNQ135 TaxID=3400922 RepID=UPI003C0C479B